MLTSDVFSLKEVISTDPCMCSMDNIIQKASSVFSYIILKFSTSTPSPRRWLWSLSALFSITCMVIYAMFKSLFPGIAEGLTAFQQKKLGENLFKNVNHVQSHCAISTEASNERILNTKTSYFQRKCFEGNARRHALLQNLSFTGILLAW